MRLTPSHRRWCATSRSVRASWPSRGVPHRRSNGCADCEEELAQRRQDDGGAGGSEPAAGQDRGASLNAPIRQRLETTTGLDLADVRVHSGAGSRALARSINARAFTHGQDIWLGARQSPDDLDLMAHEVAHVVQQGSGRATPDRVQRAPADYRHPEDGGNVAGRMQARIDEEVDEEDREEAAGQETDSPAAASARRHEARSRSAQIDRGELAGKRGELEPGARPDVDRPAAEQPRVEQAQSETQSEADSPVKPIAKGEGEGGPGKEGGKGKEAVSAADAAAELADAAFADAASQPMPTPEAVVMPPPPVAPMDAGGQPLPGDPDAEDRIAALATAAQGLRQEGTRVRSFATEERGNAQVLSGNIALVRGNVTQAEQGVTKSQEHLAFRKELAAQARKGLAVSEEKAATVAAEAPNYASKADEGKAESGPMSSEASGLAAENAANTPDDEEAAANAQEQGGKMNQAGSDIATTDDAVTQTRARADTLGEQAAQAKETNKATTTKLDTMDETLTATSGRLAEMTEHNAMARGQFEALASAPGEQMQQANTVDERGASLITASFDMEQRLDAVQRDYAQGMASVPAALPPEEEQAAPEVALEAVPEAAPEAVPEVAPEAEGVIQRAPVDSAERIDIAAEARQMEVAPGAPAAAVRTAGAMPMAGGVPGVAAGTQQAAAAPPAADQTKTPPSEPGAEDAGAVDDTGDGGGADEEALADGEEAGAEAEAPPLPQREKVDVTGGLAGALPEWVTGVPTPNEEQRATAAAEAEERRQKQIAEIEKEAGGHFENLSATDKMGIALRMTGRNLFGSVGNIKWPGFGHLALGMIDPRGPLMGVVSGLGMMLSGAANLFSAEQWKRDPLGNLLKSAADIATGLTVILGSITALAGVIIAIMTAITILSFGFAAPVTGPVIAFCTTVLTTVGGWTIAVGKVALVLQALVFIKNLIDAACADTAAELQSEADQMTENVGDAANVLMQMGMAKASAVGGKAAAAEIRAAGGGVRYAAQLGARAGVGARSGIAAVGRGLKAAPGAIGRGVRALPGAIARGARALPGAVGRGARAAGGLIGRGARAAGGGLRSLGARGLAAARALPGRVLAGARALPGRVLAGARALPGRVIGGIKGLPGRLGESFKGGFAREFLIGEDIASFGGARAASAEARAAVLAEARAPGGALAGEARTAGTEAAEARPTTVADDAAPAERPGAAAGERPAETPAAREAGVAESGTVPNEELTPGQLRNEADELSAHPEQLEGTAPNRQRRMGEHEWREQPDGSFCRFSPTRICVDTPELQKAEVAKAQTQLTDAETAAAESRANAQTAREVAEAKATIPQADRAAMEAEVKAAQTRAQQARQQAAVERGRATKLRNQGLTEEANAASQRADEAIARAEAAQSDAAQWSDFLNEPQTLAKAAADAETAAQLAATEAKELAESLGRLRKFSDDLDAIAAEEAQIRARNVGRFLMPDEEFRRLKQLSENAAFIRKQMAGEIEAARNLTPELQEALRKATPFKQIEGAAARRQAFLDSIPQAQKGPGGTYIDYITGEARPLSQLAPDHVVSVQEIFQMPGFKRLPVADQIEILDMPANLRFLERGLNSSKGGRPLSAWLGSEAELAPVLTPGKLTELAQLEADARKAVVAEIAKRRARMLGL